MAVPAGKDYWGRAAAGASKPQEMDGKDVKPEKSECTICMEESVSVQVRFRPCKHGACAGCVLKLRREVVFKVRAAQNLGSEKRKEELHLFQPMPGSRRPAMSCKAESELKYDLLKECMSYCSYQSQVQEPFVLLFGIAFSEVV